jgi:hypothetical protein
VRISDTRFKISISRILNSIPALIVLITLDNNSRRGPALIRTRYCATQYRSKKVSAISVLATGVHRILSKVWKINILESSSKKLKILFIN